MADDLKDEIRENAAGPAKASGDAGSVEQHKLTEQIAADWRIENTGLLVGRRDFSEAATEFGRLPGWLLSGGTERPLAAYRS